MARWLIPVVVLVLTLAGGESPAVAAETSAAQEGFLTRYAETYRFRLGRPNAPRVSPDGDTIFFLRSPARSFVQDLYALNTATGEERLLLSADSILEGGTETLSTEEKARRQRLRQAVSGIASFQLSPDGSRILVPLAGSLWLVELATGEVRELGSDAGYPIDARFSPDGSRVACVRVGDLFVLDVNAGTETRLTHGATEHLTRGTAEFVAQEEMDRHRGYWWSPDSRRIVYQETDTSELETMHIMDPTHPEIAPVTFPYPRPGKANAIVRLGVIDAGGGETRWIEWDRGRFEYLTTLTWTENAPLTILLQNRTQTAQTLFAVDPDTGSLTELITEKDPAWLNLFPGMPAWLPGGEGFLWISESEGFPRLERRDPRGGLLGPLHGEALGLRRFERLLADGSGALVRASTDPTDTRLVVLDCRPGGAPPRELTPESGTHTMISMGPGPLVVMRSELGSGEIRHRVADAGGLTGLEVRSVAESPGIIPRTEYTTVGDNPVLHASLVRPRDFTPGRKYPVIFHVYGGPHYQQVKVLPSSYLFDHWMADQGFIVVRADGRGTPARGRDWERAISHDVITQPLEDHVTVLRLLGERYPEMDLGRVGLYGWSFGGYFTAMAMMLRPDVFHAGVAGAPVADWGDYDTFYTERYLGLPGENVAGYRQSNVLTHAAKLKGPLLLIHGTDDDNVYFMHSLKLADALFRAGAEFEMLPLAGFTHMVPEPLVTERLYGGIMRFLGKHLGVESEPPGE